MTRYKSSYPWTLMHHAVHPLLKDAGKLLVTYLSARVCWCRNDVRSKARTCSFQSQLVSRCSGREHSDRQCSPLSPVLMTHLVLSFCLLHHLTSPQLFHVYLLLLIVWVDGTCCLAIVDEGQEDRVINCHVLVVQVNSCVTDGHHNLSFEK